MRAACYLPHDGSRPSLALRVDGLRDLRVLDAGDVEMPPGDIERSIHALEQAVHAIAAAGAIPVVLGGDHTIALPDATAVARHVGFGRVSIVHFDAHADTGDTDVGLLYDSRHRGESALCRRWAACLRRLDPGLRVRLNYPYRGDSDGLTTWLRRQHARSRYVGVEFELNQALVGTRSWRTFRCCPSCAVRSSLRYAITTDRRRARWRASRSSC